MDFAHEIDTELNLNLELKSKSTIMSKMKIKKYIKIKIELQIELQIKGVGSLHLLPPSPCLKTSLRRMLLVSTSLHFSFPRTANS